MFFSAVLVAGSANEEFSDWSENDTDAELLNQPNDDRYNKSVRIEMDKF